MAAVEKAAAKQHLFVFFYDSESESTRAARKVFDDAMRSLGSSVQSLVVDRRAPAEQPIVGRFGINTSPLPLVLGVAPNGAVTAGVEAKDLGKQRLRGALATPAEQECLSQLQKQRMVVVCIQNERTKLNEGFRRGPARGPPGG